MSECGLTTERVGSNTSVWCRRGTQNTPFSRHSLATGRGAETPRDVQLQLVVGKHAGELQLGVTDSLFGINKRLTSDLFFGKNPEFHDGKCGGRGRLLFIPQR